jgi:hypothetical protein
LQEKNNFRYVAAINIKIIKRNRAIISYTPKKFSTLLRKVLAVLGFLVQGVGVGGMTPGRVKRLERYKDYG